MPRRCFRFSAVPEASCSRESQGWSPNREIEQAPAVRARAKHTSRVRWAKGQAKLKLRS